MEDAISANSPVLAYNAAKVLSEKAAWDFLSSTKPVFDMATINPDIIVGPPLQAVSQPSAMNETIAFAVYNFFNGTYKNIEDVTFPFYHYVSEAFLCGSILDLLDLTNLQVDVRDVASATVAAMTTPAASGQRILQVADTISPQLVKNILEKNFPQLKGRLTPGGDPKQIFPTGVDPTGWDVSRSNAILTDWEGLGGKKWEYRQLETSVVDTVTKILELEEEWAKQA